MKLFISRVDFDFVLTLFAFLFAITCARSLPPDSFVDHGIGAKAAEARGVVTTQTADGHGLVIGVALDCSDKGYIVVTDIDSGETRQVRFPVPNSATYGSLMASNGRFYTAQGRVLLEFDPRTMEWLWYEKQTPAACYLSFTEHDGRIWAGGLGCHLVSYDPQTQQIKVYGRMDKAEEYLMSLAVDDAGWVYGGIGTARQNLVACNIATGEMVPLAAKEDRVHGTATVFATKDGKAVGKINNKTFLLYAGKAALIDPSEHAAPTRIGKVYYGECHTTFPDGRKLTAYSMDDKWLTVEDPRTGRSRRIEFQYESGGASISSLGLGPEGVVYGSTAHPMHFIRLDTRNNKLSDYGAVPAIGGGNMCSIAAMGKYVMGAVYSSGTMWLFDTTAPFNPEGKREDLAIKAEALVQGASSSNGQFICLSDFDVAFFKGDDFNASGSFTLKTSEAGKYYLHLLPLISPNYTRVQFALNGKPMGAPFDTFAVSTRVGPMQAYGPFALSAGEHIFTSTPLKTPERKPWFSICSMELNKTRLKDPNAGRAKNPEIVAGWQKDICRPGAALAHPDGKHFIMSGYADYGLVGGGIGIYNIRSKSSQLLVAGRDLPAGHSCIALQALPNGDLVAGTDIAAPGGGHPTAKEAEILILDWKTKKLSFHMVPVAGQTAIVSLAVGKDGMVYGITGGGIFFVLDPTAKKVLHSESFAKYGGAVQHGLHSAPEGAVYAMMSRAILRIKSGSFEHELLARPPKAITAGGALANGRLCYAVETRVWSFSLPQQ